MLATKVVCPNCSRTLTTATPLPIGKQILCRQCGHRFGAQAANGLQTQAPSKRLAAPLDDDDAPAAGSSKVLLFGGIIAAVVLLMVVGSSAAVAIALLRHRAPAVAPTTDPAPTLGTSDPDKPLQYCPPVAPVDDHTIPVVKADPPPSEKPWLPKEEQDKVDQTLERGLAYLRKQQGRDGSWPGHGGHSVGMAALPALTLLEAGAKTDDPQVLKAAEFVRSQGKHLNQTYDLALGILFLDRLGDPNDKPNIQVMALRLIAGQKASGGWTYNCPILNDKDERDLLTVLQQTRPVPEQPAITERPGGSPNSGGITRPGGNRTDDIISRPGGDNRTQPSGDNRTNPGSGDNRTAPGAGDNRATPKNGNDVDQPLQRPNSGDPKQPRTIDPAPAKPKADPPTPKVDLNQPKLDLATLSPVVKKIEALQPGDIATRKMPADGTDNSNTQFAILAIWVAGRYDVPTEKVGALIDRRFRTSQGTAGNWGYNYQPNNANPGGNPALTAAGLLGLAVGHGVNAGGNTATKEGLDDDQIKKGFKYLSDQLGKSETMEKNRKKIQHNGVGLYFLWSVERVGVMYNLRTFGDKDWYTWGAQMIVDNQAADGSVSLGDYPGRQGQVVDTCFALLFLKRANLAKDLSTKIEYLIDIKGIGNRN